MAMQHLRSSTAHKRPQPTGMSDGQIAINTNSASPGAFVKDSAGNLFKLGPVHVGSTAPNATPASGGQSGNSVGEGWLDNSGTNPLLKIWDGSAWQIVQPVASGTVVSTADTGSVTSTMIANGTIVDADVNASAAIAGTKVSPNFGSQNVTTTGTSTAASFIPSSSTVPTNGVYLPAANSVALSTNGTGRLFVDNGGTVQVVNGKNWNFPGFALKRTTSNVAEAKQLSFLLDGDDESDTTRTNYLNIWGTYSGAPTTGSTSTGLSASFNIGAPNSIIAHTNGSERLRITSAGLVGIGTSSPDTKVQILSGTSNSNVLKLSGTVAGRGLVVSTFSTSTDDDSVTLNAQSASGNLQFQTGGSDRLRITQLGNVGIGTTSPNAALDVYRASGATTVRVQSGAGIGDLAHDGTNLYLANAANGPLQFWTNNSEKARLTASGQLLVGTSSAFGGTPSGANLQIQSSAQFGPQLGLRGLHDGSNPVFAIFDRARGSNIVQSGDTILQLDCRGYDGASYLAAARIAAVVDGTPGTNDMPGRLVFSTTADGASSPTERMRITSGGLFKFSNDASYGGIDGNSHGIRMTTAGEWAWAAINANASNPYGIKISYTGAAPNGTGNYFLYCGDTSATRAEIRSNGGLANYQANNVNLSDINTKKDISPAADTWNCIKEWEIVNYRYKDQPDDADLNLGVIAQQVAESCPEVITVFQQAQDAKPAVFDDEGNEVEAAQAARPERLGVKEQQMYWMAIKALQEAQVRIEALEAEVAALKAQ